MEESPKRVNPNKPFTDIEVNSFKPISRNYKITEPGGLILEITSKGRKLWRCRYSFANKDGLLSLGKYPDISLKEARIAKDEIKSQIRQNIDPSLHKKIQKNKLLFDAENTFQSLSKHFLENEKSKNLSQKTIVKNTRLLSYIVADIGSIPITSITPILLLNSLKKMEKKGILESAKRACALAVRVFDYSINLGICENNPAARLTKTLTPPQVQHRAAILEKKQIGELLRTIDCYKGAYETTQALRLLPHVFVRPGELRQAQWNQFDFDKKLWTIPAEQMKMKEIHIVPLSKQALDIIKELQDLKTNSIFLFPSIRSPKRPMSDNTLNGALRRLGYAQDEMCAHGFRSIASTLLNESGKFRPDVIERQLAHVERNKVRAAYHRTDYIEERTIMMEWWSNQLDELKSSI